MYRVKIKVKKQQLLPFILVHHNKAKGHGLSCNILYLNFYARPKTNNVVFPLTLQKNKGRICNFFLFYENIS